MAELRIHLVAIGDELLVGYTLDTNSNWIAKRLTENGLRLEKLVWSSDREEDIQKNLQEAWQSADIVILTGGLGPTHDDVTRPTIATCFNDELRFDDVIANAIKQRYQRRGYDLAPGWQAMAMFPTKATPIPNARGAAPGIHYALDGKHLFSVPGVPVEMRGMVDDYILPRLIEKSKGVFRYRVIRTVGIGESNLAALIGDPAQLDPVKLAFLPSIESGVTLRLSCFGASENEVDAALTKASNIVGDRVSTYAYSTENKSVEATILDTLREKKLRLAVAESCTGGMICDRFVAIEGSSDVFERGFITYSNQSKIDLLDVQQETLETYGAVSSETAAEMALGARINAHAEIAISVTGIAGPGGGTPEKPVGLVYIGISTAKGTEVFRHLFVGDRDDNRRRATLAGLTLLYNQIQQL